MGGWKGIFDNFLTQDTVFSTFLFTSQGLLCAFEIPSTFQKKFQYSSKFLSTYSKFQFHFGKNR